MALTKVAIVNYHNGGGAVTGVTSNARTTNVSGYGTLFADLLDIDGNATGISCAFADAGTDTATSMTVDSAGRVAGENTLAQEINTEAAYGTGSGGNCVVRHVFTFPASHPAVTVDIFLCTTYVGQTALSVDVNGDTPTSFDSTNNTGGTYVRRTGVTPNGSDEIIVDVAVTGGLYIMHNGFRLTPEAAASTQPPRTYYSNRRRRL